MRPLTARQARKVHWSCLARARLLVAAEIAAAGYRLPRGARRLLDAHEHQDQTREWWWGVPSTGPPTVPAKLGVAAAARPPAALLAPKLTASLHRANARRPSIMMARR